MATVSTGTVVSYDRRSDTLGRYTAWEKVITFPLISGDTTGLTVIPINGLLQKIIVTLTDMEGAEGTLDVSLTDNNDKTIWSVTDLPESLTYNYSVSEPLARKVNVLLVFDDPVAGATVTVILRGI